MDDGAEGGEGTCDDQRDVHTATLGAEVFELSARSSRMCTGQSFAGIDENTQLVIVIA